MIKTLFTKTDLDGNYTYTLKEFDNNNFVIWKSNNKAQGADFEEKVGEFCDKEKAEIFFKNIIN